jgi:hypothetical protein
VIWQRCKLPATRDWETAYLKNRRREHANLIHNVLTWHLRTRQISHVSSSYDARNAFHSIFLDKLSQIVQQIARPEDVAFLEQRIRQAVITVQTDVGFIHYSVGQGSLPGDSIAAHIFRITYAEAITEWLERTRDDDDRRLAATDMDGQDVDIATTVYADDVRRTSAQQDFASLPATLNTHDEELTRAISAVGVAQSDSKVEHVFRVFGESSNEFNKALGRQGSGVKGRKLKSMTVLGSITHWKGSNELELRMRFQASLARWIMLGELWTSRIRLNIRKMVYYSIVVKLNCFRFFFGKN